MRLVDLQIRGMVIAIMSDKNHAAAINAARARTSERLGVVERMIKVYEEGQESIAAKWGALKMSDKAFDKANEPLLKQLAPLYAERNELTGGNPNGPIKALTRQEAIEKWDAADIGEQRAMLTDALDQDTHYLDPSDLTGFRKFDPKRVRIEPYKPNRARTRRASA